MELIKVNFPSQNSSGILSMISVGCFPNDPQMETITKKVVKKVDCIVADFTNNYFEQKTEGLFKEV